jgi:hypothetical protein
MRVTNGIPLGVFTPLNVGTDKLRPNTKGKYPCQLANC